VCRRQGPDRHRVDELHRGSRRSSESHGGSGLKLGAGDRHERASGRGPSGRADRRHRRGRARAERQTVDDAAFERSALRGRSVEMPVGALHEAGPWRRAVASVNEWSVVSVPVEVILKTVPYPLAPPRRSSRRSSRPSLHEAGIRIGSVASRERVKRRQRARRRDPEDGAPVVRAALVRRPVEVTVTSRQQLGHGTLPVASGE